MNLTGLQAILMYLSVTPLRTSTITEKNLKNSNILDEKISSIEDNNAIDSLNSFIEPDEQFNEEMSVEKSFADLSGKRKIVTYESLVGWDVVADLLQDGALNKEVTSNKRGVEWSGVEYCVVLCCGVEHCVVLCCGVEWSIVLCWDVSCCVVYSTVVSYHIPSSLLSPLFSPTLTGPKGVMYASRRKEESLRRWRYCASDFLKLRGAAGSARLENGLQTTCYSNLLDSSYFT